MPSRVWPFALLVLATAGCERVVDVDLAEGPKRLVVEARLERVQGGAGGAQRIRLTTTDAYFSNTDPPPARGAIVRVTDEMSRVTLFAESASEPGVYETNDLPPEVGVRYTLAIDWEGDRYEASDRLLAVAPIDSIYFLERRGFLGPIEGLRATIDFRDPPGTANYYLWDQLVDGVRLIVPDSMVRFRVVASDELVDGAQLTAFQPYGGIAVLPGQQVVVRQVALSEASYRYYYALSDQTSNGGSPFGVAPAGVRGNVANLTRPSRYPLGYFIAAEVSEARAIVPTP
jgi:hypothetical protein